MLYQCQPSTHDFLVVQRLFITESLAADCFSKTINSSYCAYRWWYRHLDIFVLIIQFIADTALHLTDDVFLRV